MIFARDRVVNEKRLEQLRQIEQRAGVDLRISRELVAGRSGVEHPGRDLQSSAGGVDDSHGTVSCAGGTDDFEFASVEWVEGVVDRDLRVFRTYGLVTC